MSEIHVQQIRAFLIGNYVDHIDVSDHEGRPEEDRTTIALTRSLAAFAISHLADVEPIPACASVTDGYQDNGIDSIYYDQAEKIFYLCQSKWKQDGTGSIQRGDIQKFITGVKDLINARFERFNEKIASRKDEISQAINHAQTRFMLVLAYTGQDPLGDEPQRDLDDFLADLNDPSELVRLRVLRQVNIHGAVSQGAQGAPINLEVVLHDWGHKREPYYACYGQVAASDIAQWWDTYHPRLFAPNIRMFLGNTEVNQSILDTLKSEPDKFWYFNNGITALCGSIQKKPIGGDSRDSGVFECNDVTIVNGAQTVGSVAMANSVAPEIVSTARVPVRFISLEQCPDEFGNSVTRATNTQNRIENRDFVSLDPEQERLRGELVLDDVQYLYKSGQRSTRESSTQFDLTDATIALACSQQDVTLAVQAKREIGVLWEDIRKPPYKTLFNSRVSGRRLWRTVQILREIDRLLIEQGKGREGRERMFTVHGNRFLAHQVYKRLPLHQLDQAGAPMEEILGKVNELVPDVIASLIAETNSRFRDSYLATLFKNLSKCKAIDEAMVRADQAG